MKSVFGCHSAIFYLALISVLSACGGGSGSSSSASNATPSSAVRTTVLEAGDVDCSAGGILVETGIDENGNGLLDDDEVDSADKVCNGIDGSDGNDGTNGADGSDGLDAIVLQTAEPAGTNCSVGGVRFDVGIDINNNALLDDAEITSTDIICETQAALSDNARLDGIQLSLGQLDQVFQSSQLEYTATVNYPVSNIQITAFTEDENATLTVNGQAIDSGEQTSAIELLAGDNSLMIEVTAENGSTTRLYDLVVTRQSLQSFAQHTFVKASNTGLFDEFGTSVAVSGDTLVVGVPAEDSDSTGVNGAQNDFAPSSGAVYVFTRTAGIWNQQAFVKASNTGVGDEFGTSVALFGDTLAVGASLEDSDSNGVNNPQNDDASGSGAVYVFTRTAGIWSEQAFIKASNTGVGDSFGASVALDGDTLAVGANLEDSDSAGVNGAQNDDAGDSGAVYIFTRLAGIWSEQAFIKASNNTGGNDSFGFSVALSDDTLAVGARYEDSDSMGVNVAQNDASSNAGAVYVFTRSAGVWSEQAFVKASNTGAGDRFGSSVALSGDTLAVGAELEDSDSNGVNGSQNDAATDSGAVYVFTRTAGIWSEQAFVKASNTGSNDQFGTSVALSGDTLAVGANSESSDSEGINNLQNEGALASGAVYVFNRSSSIWNEKAFVKASNTGGLDQFGTSVALDGDTLAAGAIGERSDSTGVNGVQNDGAIFSGAVYITEVSEY